MTKVDINKISDEQKLAIEREMCIEAYQVAIMALVDMGDSDGALNYLRPHMRMSGHAFSINMSKLFEIQGDDLDKIGDLCFLYEKFFQLDMLEIERTTDRIVRVGGTHCPWQGSPKEGCISGHEMVLNGVCESINSEYRCEFTQMIPKGDPICSYFIEKKKK
jgi:hypothetical protein